MHFGDGAVVHGCIGDLFIEPDPLACLIYTFIKDVISVGIFINLMDKHSHLINTRDDLTTENSHLTKSNLRLSLSKHRIQDTQDTGYIGYIPYILYILKAVYKPSPDRTSLVGHLISSVGGNAGVLR